MIHMNTDTETHVIVMGKEKGLSASGEAEEKLDILPPHAFENLGELV